MSALLLAFLETSSTGATKGFNPNDSNDCKDPGGRQKGVYGRVNRFRLIRRDQYFSVPNVAQLVESQGVDLSRRSIDGLDSSVVHEFRKDNVVPPSCTNLRADSRNDGERQLGKFLDRATSKAAMQSKACRCRFQFEKREPVWPWIGHGSHRVEFDRNVP